MRSSQLLLTFVFGFSLGLIFSLLIFSKRSITPGGIHDLIHKCKEIGDDVSHHEHVVMPEQFVPDSPDHSHKEWDKLLSYMGEKLESKNWTDQHDHEGEDFISKDLYKSVRVFCWIMTAPESIQSKAVHIKATWLKRCNGYVFMSSKQEDSLPAVGLSVSEGRGHLWGKTKAAFEHIYKHFLNEYDFFLKADDDSFVIVENLRLLLRDYNASEAYYTGRRFKPYVKMGYMSGGAGYVLSREAVRRMVEKGIRGDKCRKDEGGAEDVNMGQCMEAVGAKIIDSIDSLGRERFHPFPPESHLSSGHIPKNNWLWSYAFYPLKTGAECCSDTTISFHYISPSFMYVMQFFVYHLKAFGVVRDLKLVKAKLLKMMAQDLKSYRPSLDTMPSSPKIINTKSRAPAAGT